MCICILYFICILQFVLFILYSYVYLYVLPLTHLTKLQNLFIICVFIITLQRSKAPFPISSEGFVSPLTFLFDLSANVPSKMVINFIKKDNFARSTSSSSSSATPGCTSAGWISIVPQPRFLRLLYQS